MALSIKDAFDILKPLFDFIRIETPVYSLSLANYLRSAGRRMPYDSLRSAIVGNVFSSIFTAISLALSVVVYVVLFFTNKLQYNLDGRFILGSISLIAVNLGFSCAIYALFRQTSCLAERSDETLWSIALTENLPDFIFGLILPIFVLGSVDLYYSGLNGEANPLDVACALPSGYLPLGFIPIVLIRLFVVSRIGSFVVQKEGNPISGIQLNKKFFVYLTMISLFYSIIQTLIVRSMLFYSILAFDPC